MFPPIRYGSTAARRRTRSVATSKTTTSTKPDRAGREPRPQPASTAPRREEKTMTTKAITAKIEAVTSRLKRDNYPLTMQAVARKVPNAGWMIDVDVRDARDISVVLENFDASTPNQHMIDVMNHRIADYRKRKAAHEKAEREKALSRRATDEEKRAFEKLVFDVENAFRAYAQYAGKMRDKINDGAQIYGSMIDDLAKAEAGRSVAIRVWSCLRQPEGIVAALNRVSDLCDHETAYFEPNRSTSNGQNMVYAYENAAYMRAGATARLKMIY
ncbi:hypothetical protein FDH48_gp70 [Arthrobacter phage Jawnski]|uniref:Uncharacterized protein n=1 Tax=Arthrobacter phage Jawnski TaxID=1772327 RepID=A0A0U4IVG6_9CAUD|nr:hypothetical protein FDH48_gp70 [Arthrobacter phage Jawnski]ALY09399.1 hypothetical protein JAWNSKI_70 [Arthrobacter phage Jawnski]